MHEEALRTYPPSAGVSLLGERGRRYVVLQQLGRPGFRGIAYLVEATDTVGDCAILKLPNLDGNLGRMSTDEWIAETSADFLKEDNASRHLRRSVIASRVPLVRHVDHARFRTAGGDLVVLPYLIRNKLDAVALDRWAEDLAKGHFYGVQTAMWRLIAADICWLVGEMHAAHVVHGDIRPANVRIREDGRRIIAHLIDFGQSWIIDEDEAHPGSCSTRHPYYPPERLTGRWDRGADVYSVGGILLYLAVGEAPPSPFVDPAMDKRDDFAHHERVLHDFETFRMLLRDRVAEKNNILLTDMPDVVDVIAACMHPQQELRVDDLRDVASRLRQGSGAA